MRLVVAIKLRVEVMGDYSIFQISPVEFWLNQELIGTQDVLVSLELKSDVD